MAYKPKYYMDISVKHGYAHVYLFIDTVGMASLHLHSRRSLNLILT